MKQLLLIVLLAAALGLAAAEYRALPAGTRANSLVVRLSFDRPVDPAKLPELQGEFRSGVFRRSAPLLPLNPVTNRLEADFELPLGEEIVLAAGSVFRLPDLPPGLTLREVVPVRFRADDLSSGLDFETGEGCGVWVGNLRGQAAWERSRGFRGTGSLKAVWEEPAMVSLLPGERDWTRYAELRFTVSNPMPGEEGRRNRNMFLYDGKKVWRPTPKDSIPQGNLDLMPESSREFRLDLERLKRNCPGLDLADIRAVQFFWSSTKVAGETVFYFDDVRLLTAEELEAERAAVYLDRFRALEALAGADRSGEVTALRRRFDAGEREALLPAMAALQERIVCASVAGDAALRIVAADPSVKIMRDTPFEFREFPVRLSAAGNERESFQLVLAPKQPLRTVTVTPGDLTGPAVIPAACVEVNPVGYVEVAEAFYYPTSRTGYWPDILHENRPFDLPARVQPFMVTVKAPEHQAPGEYRGLLTVAAAGLEPRTVEYTLQVYDFSLPVRGKLQTFFGLSYLPDDPALRRKVYDRFFDYRLNPVSMYQRINRPPAPPTRIIPPFEDLPYCLEKGLNFICFGYMHDVAKKPDRREYFDQAYIDAVLAWIGQCRPVLQQYGAWEMAHLVSFDEVMHQPEPERSRRLAEAEKICRAVKNAFPDCKIANVGRLMEISPELMDRWYTIPSPRRDFRKVRQGGGKVGMYWVYEDPSFMLDLPGIAPRVCPWLAYREGADGVGYYSTYRAFTVNPAGHRSHADGGTICHEACNPDPVPATLDWSREQFNILGTKKFARNGDGVLFYPAPDHSLLGSCRLINLRDGIEDVEYLKLLEALSGGRHPLLKVPDELVTLTSYTRDATLLRARRDAVARAIETLRRQP